MDCPTKYIGSTVKDSGKGKRYGTKMAGGEIWARRIGKFTQFTSNVATLVKKDIIRNQDLDAFDEAGYQGHAEDLFDRRDKVDSQAAGGQRTRARQALSDAYPLVQYHKAVLAMERANSIRAPGKMVPLFYIDEISAESDGRRLPTTVLDPAYSIGVHLPSDFVEPLNKLMEAFLDAYNLKVTSMTANEFWDLLCYSKALGLIVARNEEESNLPVGFSQGPGDKLCIDSLILALTAIPNGTPVNKLSVAAQLRSTNHYPMENGPIIFLPDIYTTVELQVWRYNRGDYLTWAERKARAARRPIMAATTNVDDDEDDYIPSSTARAVSSNKEAKARASSGRLRRRKPDVRNTPVVDSGDDSGLMESLYKKRPRPNDGRNDIDSQSKHAKPAKQLKTSREDANKPGTSSLYSEEDSTTAGAMPSSRVTPEHTHLTLSRDDTVELARRIAAAANHKTTSDEAEDLTPIFASQCFGKLILTDKRYQYLYSVLNDKQRRILARFEGGKTIEGLRANPLLLQYLTSICCPSLPEEIKWLRKVPYGSTPSTTTSPAFGLYLMNRAEKDEIAAAHDHVRKFEQRMQEVLDDPHFNLPMEVYVVRTPSVLKALIDMHWQEPLVLPPLPLPLALTPPITRPGKAKATPGPAPDSSSSYDLAVQFEQFLDSVESNPIAEAAIDNNEAARSAFKDMETASNAGSMVRYTRAYRRLQAAVPGIHV